MFNRLAELFKVESVEAFNDKIGYAVICMIFVVCINSVTTYRGGCVVRLLSNIISIVLLICAATWGTVGVYWYKSNESVVQYSEKDTTETPEALQIDFIVMQTEYTVQQGGTLMCDVFNLSDTQLTEDDILLGEGLTAKIMVLTADETVNRSILNLTNINAPVGVYNVDIGEACTLSVRVISEKISTEIQLNCIPSTTLLNDGETITISALYTGIAVENKTATYIIDTTFITFENMVGTVKITNATEAVYNISVSGVCILDKNESAFVIINSGSAIDGSGVACHAVVVEVTADTQEQGVKEYETEQMA